MFLNAQSLGERVLMDMDSPRPLLTSSLAHGQICLCGTPSGFLLTSYSSDTDFHPLCSPILWGCFYASISAYLSGIFSSLSYICCASGLYPRIAMKPMCFWMRLILPSVVPQLFVQVYTVSSPSSPPQLH